MRLLVVIGTRPEAIKLAPVVLEAQSRQDIEIFVVVTGQHREMLEQMLKVFQITPDCDLSIMKQDQGLAHITVSALNGLHKIIGEYVPDIVIVQGDTTTTFVGALAAFYHHIPVAHVEAGLRTFDKLEPFPEEVNRCMTSQLATLHFAPTEIAKNNLLAENIAEQSIHVTGNTAIDALHLTLSNKNVQNIKDKSESPFRTILVTAHRRENHGERMETICKAILALLKKFDDIDFLFPVHMSPRVRNVVYPQLSDHPRVRLVEPMDYVEFVMAMNDCYLILTDSGGVQEEAPSLGKPVLVLRDQTERPEALQAGKSILVGANYNRIIDNVSNLLSDGEVYKSMAKTKNPYGDGQASVRIVDAICQHILQSETSSI